MNCKFCNQEKKSIMSLKGHERCCKQNPDRKLTWMEKQYDLGIKFIPTEETKEKLRQKALKQRPKTEEEKINIGKKLIFYYSDPENKKKFSNIMKKAVLKNPESYSDNNIVGRCKHFTVDGVRFHSKWEYDVVKCFDEYNIKWVRKGIKPISYFWNESWHLYFPDFFLPDFDIYIEVKGYETERDRQKWKYCDKAILVIKKNEIDKIKNNEYDIFREIHAVSIAEYAPSS